MSNFFGTDGIRGVFNKDLTLDLVKKVGFALSKKGKKFVIGRDTRTSGKHIVDTFCESIVFGGKEIVDVGIIPTPGISFLTKKLGFDFGIMITASHNPKEYNGIKIFDKDGQKISNELEKELEQEILNFKEKKLKKHGKYVFSEEKNMLYRDFLIQNTEFDLKDLRVLIDASNGAAYKIAPEVFRCLDAKVDTVFCENNGNSINENCGALYAQNLEKKAKKYDITFTFDGDADRIVAIDKNGKIIDGDRIMLILFKYLRYDDDFNSNAIVATKMSNISIEKELKKDKCLLIRTNVGDKFVTKALIENNLTLGGEQSGHIILTKYGPTGDGIMCALKLCEVLLKRPDIFDYVMNLKFYVQIIENIEIHDKKIINNSSFQNYLIQLQDEMGENGRIYVRASGTEPLIRLMVECKQKTLALKTIKNLKNKLNELS